MKIILTILAVEHLGFGLYGLYDPNSIAELTGYILNSEFALSKEVKNLNSLVLFTDGHIAMKAI